MFLLFYQMEWCGTVAPSCANFEKFVNGFFDPVHLVVFQVGQKLGQKTNLEPKKYIILITVPRILCLKGFH